MTRVIVMFNLKPGIQPEQYEAWARSVDIPTVRQLAGVAGFTVHRSTGLLVGDGEAPYDYTEILDIEDMEAFLQTLGTEEMQTVAGEFQSMALDPVFVQTEAL